MADDQTAALIARARRMIAGTTSFQVYPRREQMIARLADALERAQGRIDGVLAHRKWLLDMMDEAAKAGTEAGDYNAWVYRSIIEDLDRALSAQVKPDGE